MQDVNPSILETKQILKATLAALIVGILLFVAAVLPVEYGVDPLGTGKLSGLSRLYQPDDTGNTPASGVATVNPQDYPPLKLADLGSDPEVPMPREAQNPAPVRQFESRQDSANILVPAGKGLEYKMNVLKHGRVEYEWITDRGVLYVDFHGEVKEQNLSKEEFYESYTVAYSDNMAGTFLAPYEGRHGWYFKNKTDRDIVVSLRIKGQYTL